MPKKIKNCFIKNLTFQKLLEAHYRAKRQKKEKKEIILFELNLENNITNILNSIKNGTYNKVLTSTEKDNGNISLGDINFEIKDNTIMFSDNNSQIVLEGTYTIEDNVDFSQIIPEIYGYEFLGWYRDSDLTVPASNITAGTTGNVTVYASYREIVVTIHFSEQFDDITVAFESMAYGTSGVLNDIVPTREGYTFGGWYTSEDFSTRSYIDPNRPYYFTKDVTLYAKWDAKANPAIIWVSVAFAALAVIGFVLWWILFRPRYKE